MDPFANNPLLAMGAGLLSAAGPTLVPGRANLGVGLSQGLLNVHQMRKQKMHEQAVQQELALRQQRLALEQQKYAHEQSVLQQQQAAVDRLAKQIAAADGDPSMFLNSMAAGGNIAGALKAANIPDPDAGAFAGQSMTGQSWNAMIEAGTLLEAGKPIPSDLRAKVISGWHELSQARPVGNDPVTGAAIYKKPTMPREFQAIYNAVVGGAAQATGAGLPPMPSPTSPVAPPAAQAPVAAAGGQPPISPAPAPAITAEQVLAEAPVGSFITDPERLAALRLPPDASVRVVGTPGGGKDLDILSTGSKETADERRRVGQMEMTDVAMNDVREALKAGVNPSSMGTQMKRFASEPGILSYAAREYFKTNPEEAKLFSALELIKNTLIQIARGAQVSEGEQRMFERQLPVIGQDRNVFEANMRLTEKNIEIAKRRYKERTGKEWAGDQGMTIVGPGSGQQPATQTIDWGSLKR
jgi:hypothetical protein